MTLAPQPDVTYRVPRVTRRLRVYVAASYADREDAQRVMRILELESIEVTSTWLRVDERHDSEEERRRVADLDIDDVTRAHAVLAWTPSPRREPRGTLVEVGVAIGQGKPVVWVGRSGPHDEAIFYWSSHVTRVASLAEAVHALTARCWPTRAHAQRDDIAYSPERAPTAESLRAPHSARGVLTTRDLPRPRRR